MRDNMQKVIDQLPAHLKRFVVAQNYEKYTSEDQAVWRYIMMQLRKFLSQHAHDCYLEGLEKTGITTERIPRIEDISKKLNKFGWGAIPVSGFIPPAAFMEFQSLGILPIASDMRSIDHILYTPAPDIVHEAAGHAPILINQDFANYLKKYADVARRAILSKEDLDQYEAIRVLSDLKENPESSEAEVLAAEKHLQEVSDSITEVSEAAWLSRMNWWTAEYGLIGQLEQPKIFGAGLLSSVGESRECLSEKVKKIPLTVECVETGYDITEPQPQLFVTPSFENLHHVLEQLSEKMAYKRGGHYGLQRAFEARTVNTVQLDSGLQFSGKLDRFELNQSNEPVFLKFSGPTQISTNDKQLTGHGTDYHSQGYSTPLGSWQGLKQSPLLLNAESLKEFGVEKNKQGKIQFESGVTVTGVVKDILFINNAPVLIQWSQCHVSWNSETLFEPNWGLFDMAVGLTIPSVFAGPADPVNYENTTDFATSQVPLRTFSKEQFKTHQLFSEVRELRENPAKNSQSIDNIYSQWRETSDRNWLLGLEILELSRKIDINFSQKLQSEIDSSIQKDFRKCFQDGLKVLESH